MKNKKAETLEAYLMQQYVVVKHNHTQHIVVKSWSKRHKLLAIPVSKSQIKDY